MKYLFSLFLILFFTFSAVAVNCPADRPLLGNDGICYSCDEKNEITINEESLGKSCSDICPNRESSTGFYTTTAVPCAIHPFVALDEFIIYIFLLLMGIFVFLAIILPIHFFCQIKTNNKKGKTNSTKKIIIFFIFYLACTIPWVIIFLLP